MHRHIDILDKLWVESSGSGAASRLKGGGTA